MHDLSQRDGVIELSLRRDPTQFAAQKVTRQSDGSFQLSDAHSWKVRVFAVEPDGIVVERPWSITQDVRFHAGMLLDGLMVDGLRRWTFTCRIQEVFRHALNERKQVICLRLSRPGDVQDGQRRNYFRVETVGAALPSAHLWHLLDHDGCAEYEHYCRLRHRASPEERDEIIEPPSPCLGDDFPTKLMDVSAGGLGVLVKREMDWLLPTAPLLWTKIVLPDIEEPLFAVSRLAHWREESDVYFRLGLCFNFDHNPSYRSFFVDQLCRFSAEFQRQQLQRKR
ncbi:hypothetical protein HED60_07535 [Planctomycetales bacterium ZRK34]|nr:hypothetical protein HED60_07535 [Planctomycetales bacterium ZRK34]